MKLIMQGYTCPQEINKCDKAVNCALILKKKLLKYCVKCPYYRNKCKPIMIKVYQ
jgi:hypothetical protein